MLKKDRSGPPRYFDILKYDIELSIRRAELARNPNRSYGDRQFDKAEARAGYESMSETLRIADLTLEEITGLRNKLEQLRGVLWSLGEKFESNTNRGLKRVEWLSTDQMYVYVCDACQWIIEAPPDAKWEGIQQKFETHACQEKARSHTAGS